MWTKAVQLKLYSTAKAGVQTGFQSVDKDSTAKAGVQTGFQGVDKDCTAKAGTHIICSVFGVDSPTNHLQHSGPLLPPVVPSQSGEGRRKPM